MSQDPSYCVARAVEERGLAMATADSKVRRIHLEMAARYAVLAGTTDVDDPDQKEKTA